MDRKCKDPDHVDVVPTGAAGDAVGMWACVKRYNYHCRNAVESSGDVYALVHGHAEGMHMLPELAAVMPTRIRMAAAAGANVRIRHRVLGIRLTYASLSHGAAIELANNIEAVMGT